MSDEDQTRRFRHFKVGRSLCLMTMAFVDECPHCAYLDAQPKKTLLVVAEVDREAGVVTFETRDAVADGG